MYVKEVTSFCQVLKKVHTKENWSFFSASWCIQIHTHRVSHRLTFRNMIWRLSVMANNQVTSVQLHWIGKKMIHNRRSNLATRKHDVRMLCATKTQQETRNLATTAVQKSLECCITMFINFHIARPTYCFIFMYACHLTVVTKPICSVV